VKEDKAATVEFNNLKEERDQEVRQKDKELKDKETLLN
jgi:hypothetical protein